MSGTCSGRRWPRDVAHDTTRRRCPRDLYYLRGGTTNRSTLRPRPRGGTPRSGEVHGPSRSPVITAVVRPIEEAFAYQVATQRGYVTVPATKPPIDLALSVVNAGIEVLGKQVEKYDPLRTLGRNCSQSSVPNECPKHSFSFTDHEIPSGPSRCRGKAYWRVLPLSSNIELAHSQSTPAASGQAGRNGFRCSSEDLRLRSSAPNSAQPVLTRYR
jgi:hypothetical protein